MAVPGLEPVVLDASVLVPPSLCDLLLRLAMTPALYRPVWTPEILAEVTRNQPTATKLSPARIATWPGAVTGAFPEAMVTRYAYLIPRCTNQEKDRHVLAAAIAGGARTIVTFNLRDFPEAALAPHEVRAISPDDFLITLFTEAPEEVEQHLRERATRLKRTMTDLLALHEKTVPAFAMRMRDELDLDRAQ